VNKKTFDNNLSSFSFLSIHGRIKKFYGKKDRELRDEVCQKFQKLGHRHDESQDLAHIQSI